MEAMSKASIRTQKTQDTTARTSHVYSETKKELSEWPKWKKDAYNENFAISAHAKKM